MTFAEGCTVFQLSTSECHPLSQYQQWRYLDAYNFFNITRQVAPRDRIDDLQWYTKSTARFLVIIIIVSCCCCYDYDYDYDRHHRHHYYTIIKYSFRLLNIYISESIMCIT